MKTRLKHLKYYLCFQLSLMSCGGGSSGTSEEITTPIVTPPPVNNALAVHQQNIPI